MNFPGGGNTPSPRKELQLQGPRPAALKVNKDSHKIRKPPIAPPKDERQPVIIYAVSPKVIHTNVTDFMNLVQRLTGNTGDLSPAARLASIETTSPSDNRQIITQNESDIEVGSRGILSPAPSSLPPISPGFFSQPEIGYSYNYNNNMFLPSSPSNLFSAPLVSPSPSSFNPFFDF